ncbi:replicative DNA helicase [Cocleimonas flava]|jgi:replicative DNA helicase|uniref:Replicative DNA helicase n=1 Tax=Cocleimonas flava TaxID=634765 RepID=A0A4R1EZA3_9GAMM|nr:MULTISPECIES: replicative DNA helicase [Cocleimonas]MEB8433602.1 replicative DNA helicase [Cocleimonas sp. KMM 6892]MEC4716413.1 replicative DNA helicase [Cocleimonas sp. KMM 6895]MEC4745694.1 replicative DNA helicase [Cocleimonas sp. KMM 6896]TCJ85249.1 primary replicative DNA helicase [Cocleimonas flava]
MSAILTQDSAVEHLKVPPHSIEAEQSVLGGLLLENMAWDKIADIITEHDFYRHDHRLIFRSIAVLAETDKPRDVITLSEWLKDRDELENAGGLAYLGTLAKDTPSAANIKAYADIVREKSVLRQLISIGSEIAEEAFNAGDRPSKELLDEAEKKVFEIAEQGNRKQDFHTIKDLLKSTLAKIDELSKSTDALTGASTGYTDLDGMTSGLQKGDLIIVAGRPSMGKTTFSMNLAEYIAVNDKKPVAIFSMEMPAEQLILRMFASMGRVPLNDIRNGKIREEDWPRIGMAVKAFGETKLFIDDTAAMSPTEVRAKCRRLHREHGHMGLVVLDYIQLMQTGAKSDNRAAEISEISRSLKALAKELECPVIALSQLNRSLEQRPNKRPIMSDLRESGAIEQDADVIMFIYRDEVYDENTPDKGMAEVIIGKQRQGAIGKVRLTFTGKYTRFDNFMPDIYAPEN